ncbi:MAG TPA: hypothetical protein VEC11_14625 [Allosphingosinicella sp.]|nr:hypothetical protein [Allosphingosinicella sp.]
MRERRRRALVRLAILFVLLLSPLGAPAVGLLLTTVWEPNFFTTYPRPCVLPHILTDYFTGMLFVSLTPGSLVIAALWLVLAGGVVLGFLVYAVTAAWLYGVERAAAEQDAAPDDDGAVL